MADGSPELLTRVLRDCAGTDPEPLYPSAYAQQTGLDRAAVDQALDALRLRGLVQITEWVKDLGQGYALTDAGREAVAGGIDPRRAPKVPPPAPIPGEVPSPNDTAARIRDVFVAPPKPVVSWTLIGSNVFIFLAGMFLASHRYGATTSEYLNAAPRVLETLYDLGGLSPRWFWSTGEWWRLLTYAFVHIGLLHVVANMYFLYALGPMIESMWGAARYLLLYTIAAITGGCVVLWVQGDANTLTAGASGALSGVAASMAMWLWLSRDYLPPPLYLSLTRSITMNLILLAAISFLPNISWQGHLGGAVGGALAAYPLNVSRFGEGRLARALGFAGVLLVPTVFLALTFGRAWWGAG